MTDEMDTLRREAIMETVDVLQRAVWLFMHAQRQSQNAAWWGARMDADAPRDDCPYAGRLCDCEAMDCPAACDCETCPDKDACKCC